MTYAKLSLVLYAWMRAFEAATLYRTRLNAIKRSIQPATATGTNALSIYSGSTLICGG